jgi:hypothetical protein
MVKVPLCSNAECEESVKAKTSGAKPLFIAEGDASNKKCIHCAKDAEYFVYFGKTY